MTLWVFGDSFSSKFNHELNLPWSSEYIKYLGFIPPIYVDEISNSLKCNVKNISYPGISNYDIIDLISINYEQIKDDDIVIIGWTSPTRWRYVDNSNNWKVVGSFNKDNGNNTLLESTIDEISFNRTNNLYKDEVVHRSKIVKYSLSWPNRFVFQWSWYNYEYQNINYIRGERITDETRGRIGDNHFSRNTHIKFANKILKEYETFKINIK